MHIQCNTDPLRISDCWLSEIERMYFVKMKKNSCIYFNFNLGKRQKYFYKFIDKHKIYKLRKTFIL